MRRACRLAGLVAGAALTWSQPAHAEDCASRVPVECNRISVPLDPSGAVAGVVELHVERVGSARAESRAVMPLVGGPGQPSSSLVAPLTKALSPALRGRDLVAVDLRGTGRSTPLECAAVKESPDPREAAGPCAAELGARATLFGTDEVVEDLELVRRHFGYEQLTLVGISYGTHVALAYAAKYPDRVERLILDSPVPPDGVDPFNLTTLRGVSRVLDAACVRACRSFTRSPGADIRKLVARMGGRSIRGPAFDRRGRKRIRSVNGAHLLQLLTLGDLTALIRPRIPSAVSSALRDDNAPLLRLVGILESHEAQLNTTPPGLSLATNIATLCEDTSFPWAAGTPASERPGAARAALSELPPSAFAPFDAATAFEARVSYCDKWPTASRRPPFDTTRLPDVPVLIFSAGHDLRTPYENAVAAARLFPRSRLVAVPQATHAALPSDLDTCARRAIESFLSGAPTPAPCPRRTAPLVAPSPLAPARLSEVRRHPRLPGRAGRLLNAVALTVADAYREAGFLGAGTPESVAVGGLRGGFYRTFEMRFGPRNERVNTAIRMHSLEYVPGVEVSGVARGNAYWNLTIRYRGKTVGRLVTKRRFIAEGALDGRGVSIRAPKVFF